MFSNTTLTKYNYFTTSATKFIREYLPNIACGAPCIYFTRLYDKHTGTPLYNKPGRSDTLYTRMHYYCGYYKTEIIKIFVVDNTITAENLMHEYLKKNGHILKKGNEYYEYQADSNIMLSEIEYIIKPYIVECIDPMNIENIDYEKIKQAKDKNIKNILIAFKLYANTMMALQGTIPKPKINSQHIYNGYNIVTIMEYYRKEYTKSHQTYDKFIAPIVNTINNILGFNILERNTQKTTEDKINKGIKDITSYINTHKINPRSETNKQIKIMGRMFNKYMLIPHYRNKLLNFTQDNNIMLIYKQHTINNQQYNDYAECELYNKLRMTIEFYKKYGKPHHTYKQKYFYYDYVTESVAITEDFENIFGNREDKYNIIQYDQGKLYMFIINNINSDSFYWYPELIPLRNELIELYNKDPFSLGVNQVIDTITEEDVLNYQSNNTFTINPNDLNEVMKLTDIDNEAYMNGLKINNNKQVQTRYRECVKQINSVWDKIKYIKKCFIILEQCQLGPYNPMYIINFDDLDIEILNGIVESNTTVDETLNKLNKHHDKVHDILRLVNYIYDDIRMIFKLYHLNDNIEIPNEYIEQYNIPFGTNDNIVTNVIIVPQTPTQNNNARFTPISIDNEGYMIFPNCLPFKSLEVQDSTTYYSDWIEETNKLNTLYFIHEYIHHTRGKKPGRNDNYCIEIKGLGRFNPARQIDRLKLKQNNIYNKIIASYNIKENKDTTSIHERFIKTIEQAIQNNKTFTDAQFVGNLSKGGGKPMNVFNKLRAFTEGKTGGATTPKKNTQELIDHKLEITKCIKDNIFIILNRNLHRSEYKNNIISCLSYILDNNFIIPDNM